MWFFRSLTVVDNKLVCFYSLIVFLTPFLQIILSPTLRETDF